MTNERNQRATRSNDNYSTAKTTTIKPDVKVHHHHHQQQQQQHASTGSVRHAEKRRISTCSFADRIARISIQTYQKYIPTEWQDENKQICIATIVAHFPQPPTSSSDDLDCDGENLQVLSLGVGTKFLANHVLLQEINNCIDSKRPQQKKKKKMEDAERIVDNMLFNNDIHSCYGKRVRDCHAEVLARRAFRKQLSVEIKDHLQNCTCIQTDSRTNTMIDPVTTSTSQQQQQHSNYKPILELIHPTNTTSDNNSTTISSSCCKNSSRFQFKLKDGITLHMYSSSAPCGNATLKKFTTMTKEKFDSTLGLNEWPKTKDHDPIPGHSVQLGQFSLLVKRDNANTSCLDDVDESVPNNMKIGGSVSAWPCDQSDDWCPPGTSITDTNKGCIHTCSDKICRWNCIGLQGSLLSPFLKHPLYMTTLTVGRKYTKEICQRAVCCRALGYNCNHLMKQYSSKNIQKVSRKNDLLHKNYRLNHPVLMCTAEYLDESGVLDMTGTTLVGKDARFSSKLSWVWWPGLNTDSSSVECIDSNTGFLTDYTNSEINDTSCIHAKDTNNLQSSQISTLRYTQSASNILRDAGLYTKDSSPKNNKSNNANEAEYSTLAELRHLKRTVSPEYESAKDELLLHHPIFHRWKRREGMIWSSSSHDESHE